MTDDNDPPEVIASFLTSLPDTIRNIVTMFTLLYGVRTDQSAEGVQNAETKVLTALAGRPSITLFSVALSVVAALDVILEGQAARAGWHEGVLAHVAEQEPDLPGIQETALGAPLRGRHFQQALARWRTLRSNELSLRRLLDFEDRCLRPPRVG